MPLAAYGGKRAIMEKVAPLGPVYQAGTLSGNPVAVSAGARDCSSASTRRVYDEARGARRAARSGPRRRPRRSASVDGVRAARRLDDHAVLHARARCRSFGRRGEVATPKRFGRWHGAMLARGHLLAAVAVRGGVHQRPRTPRPTSTRRSPRAPPRFSEGSAGARRDRLYPRAVGARRRDPAAARAVVALHVRRRARGPDVRARRRTTRLRRDAIPRGRRLLNGTEVLRADALALRVRARELIRRTVLSVRHRRVRRRTVRLRRAIVPLV